jgi:endonuclease/exonuclease/phosphatase family metal-dependent hydrolase
MERFYRLTPVCFVMLFLPMTAAMAGGIKTIPSSSATTGLPGVLTAMTFNIRVNTFIDGPNRWDSRKSYVFDLIRDQAPDVVGLQEAEKDQYIDVRLALPQYQGYAVGRNNGKDKGETCAILYRDNRFLRTDAGTFWFSDTPHVPGSKDWGNRPPRICSWVRLVDKYSLSAFYIYNVHLDHRSQNSRSKSVRLLTEKIAARKTKDPFIVMGDFNMDLDNSAMAYLQTNNVAPMSDAWYSIYGNQETDGTRHGFRGDSGPKIDHIPLSHELRALDVKTDTRRYNGRYPSDHFPVIAKILMPDRSFADAKITTGTTADEVF